MMESILDHFMNMSSRKVNLTFLIVMVGGSAIILSSFYMIDINALVNGEFFTIQQKVVGIGIFIVIAHVLLTCLAKNVFNKLQYAKSVITQKNEEMEKIDKAKKLIREFKSKLSHYLESGIKQEVYQINIQLFPLTQIQKGRKL